MKIKEVEKQLSISSHALRYYEKMHLIHPHRDENGYETPATDVWMPFHFEYFADQ